MLNAHSQIAAGPETHFLFKVTEQEYEHMLQDPHWPQRAVDRISRVRLVGQPVIDLFDISKEELQKAFAGAERSISGIFDAFFGIYLERTGKSTWLEKTPNHLLHLDLIRREFPEARIIRIVRDPRDSCTSMMKLKWTHSVVGNAYLWDSWFQKSKHFFETDQKSITLRYEDLLTDLEGNLKRLCSFLEIDFEPGMLDTSRGGEGISSGKESWKGQVTEGIDKSRMYRWKKKMPQKLADAVSLICAEGISYFRYEDPKACKEEKHLVNFSMKGVAYNQDIIASYAQKNVRLSEKENTSTSKKDQVVLLPLPARRKRYKPLNTLKGVFQAMRYHLQGYTVFFSNREL